MPVIKLFQGCRKLRITAAHSDMLNFVNTHGKDLIVAVLEGGDDRTKLHCHMVFEKDITEDHIRYICRKKGFVGGSAAQGTVNKPTEHLRYLMKGPNKDTPPTVIYPPEEHCHLDQVNELHNDYWIENAKLIKSKVKRSKITVADELIDFAQKRGKNIVEFTKYECVDCALDFARYRKKLVDKRVLIEYVLFYALQSDDETSRNQIRMDLYDKAFGTFNYNA